MKLDKERLRVLASDFTSHPLSRGISDIEEAGEGLYALLSENAALAAEVERLQSRVQELGQIARDNRSIKVVELESEVERLRADHAAALGLVADVRFALGDNGKRMQPELIEWCRWLRKDSGRYAWLRDVGDATWRPFGLREGYSAAKADAAIDAAMADKGALA